MFIQNYPTIKSNLLELGESKHQLTIEPLIPGFGSTLGNSLRRVLISSIPGFGVSKIRINDITHEYQTVNGVKEDALDVVLNLKGIRARIKTDADTATLTLKSKKKGDVTAKDFDSNSEVEILNKDLYICNISGDKEITIEVEISRGVGYVSYVERNLRENKEPTAILIDTNYSPVKNVSLDIEKVRVGDQTNYDKINLTFDLDETVNAKEAVDYALNIIHELFNNIQSSLSASTDEKKSKTTTAKELKSESSEGESDLELSSRVIKILEKNGVASKAELLKNADKIEEFSGLGEKSLEEIKKYIKDIK